MHLIERLAAARGGHRGIRWTDGIAVAVSTFLLLAGFASEACAGAKEMFEKYEAECVAKGWKKMSVKVGGLDRQLLWKGPSGPWARGVIVALHGGGGANSNYCANLRIGQSMVDFSDQALKAGYAMFLPDSVDTLAKDDVGNGCGKRWDSLDHPGDNQDVRFLESLINTTIPSLRPESSSANVFMIGISNGGFMTALAATKFPDLLKAFVVVSAGDPYSTALDCSAKASSSMRSTPGIFIDRARKKSIADDNGCSMPSGPEPTLAKSARPPFMFIYHERDGGVDISCKKAGIARLTKLGFPESPPFIVKQGGRKSIFKHLWQEEYNGPLLKFLESKGR